MDSIRNMWAGFVVCGALLVCGMAGAPGASGEVVEDFEDYYVLSTLTLDPTIVSGSGWSRDGVGAADWEVACCGSDGTVPADAPFDGSEAALYLRRANNNTPGASDENTDFTGFTPFTEGALSLQMNNSSTGGGGGPGNANTGTDAFNMELVGGGISAFRLTMGEIHNNAPEFELFDIETGPTALLATGNVPGGEGVSGWPDAWHRVYEITATFDGAGGYSVDVLDIGSKDDSGASARGSVLSYTGTLPAGIGPIDTLRLGVGQADGGSITYDATYIDNITSTSGGGTTVPTTPLDGVEVVAAKKIVFPTEAQGQYQVQFTDSQDILLGTWNNLGAGLSGDGGINSVFDTLIGRSNRMFRVIEILPVPAMPVVEDFEYGEVGSGTFIDITTLSANWTREGVDEPDWVVDCCSGSFVTAENTFDGSDRLLILDRANDFLPSFSDENTDFNLSAVVGGTLSNHTVQVEVNPSGTGGGNSVQGAFHMALVDSTTGLNAVRIVFYELSNNSGDFVVYDSGNTEIATGTALDNYPAAFGRWFRVSATIRENATLDVYIDDIGPTGDSPSGDDARGNILTLTGHPLGNGVTSVDTFRLLPGQSNGGSVNTRPTTIDNIAAGPVIDTAESPTGPIDLLDAVEITFPTVSGKKYQPQYSDDDGAVWTDLGDRVTGSGGTDSLFGDHLPGRTWQVLDLQP